MDRPKNPTQDKHRHHEHADHMARAKDGLKDSVCGMNVNAQSEHRTRHDGQPYYFCSAKCLGKFEADPARYLEKDGQTSSAPADASAGGTIYTCPMHPEIRQDHPGDCPKCGMSLEPELPSLDDDENPELVDFKRRFW